MVEEPVPDEVRRFIARHIDSVAQLEALLLLYRGPERRWSTSEMAQRLYIGEGEAGALLARLAADGLLLSEDGTYRFAGNDADQTALVGLLAATYAHYLVPVTNLIHNKRIRNFADAFKFRKDQ